MFTFKWKTINIFSISFAYKNKKLVIEDSLYPIQSIALWEYGMAVQMKLMSSARHTSCTRSHAINYHNIPILVPFFLVYYLIQKLWFDKDFSNWCGSVGNKLWWLFLLSRGGQLSSAMFFWYSSLCTREVAVLACLIWLSNFAMITTRYFAVIGFNGEILD